MKKILIALAATLALTTAAHADWNHGYGHHNHYYYGGGGGGDWAAPLIGGLIIGGMLGAMSQPQPQYYDPYYAPQPVYVPHCYRQLVGYDYWGRPVFQRICQ